ncbi:MAG: DUF1064 domain-containing protein [Blastocatellia bacterium]
MGRKPTKAEYQQHGKFSPAAVLEVTGATKWAEALGLSGCQVLKASHRANKFKAARTRSVDGRVFASRLEAARYEVLSLCAKSRNISNLDIQVRIPLKVNDRHICDYIADFVYRDSLGNLIVEDTKGKPTSLAITKMKLVEALYGTAVRLIRTADAPIGGTQ